MDYSYLKEHSHYATLEQSVKEGNYELTSLSFTCWRTGLLVVVVTL